MVTTQMLFYETLLVFQNLHNNLDPHNPSHVDSQQNSAESSFSWRQNEDQRGAAAGLSLPSLLPLAPTTALLSPLFHSLSLPHFHNQLLQTPGLRLSPPHFVSPTVISSLSFLGRSLNLLFVSVSSSA